MAIRTNPTIDEARANRRAQDYELKQQRGLYLPSLDATASTGPEWTKNTTVRTSKTMPRHSGQVTLSQLLFDGFGRENDIEASASRVDAAALRVFERAEAIAADVAEAYLDILRNMELVQLAEENVDVHRATLEKVRKRVAGGQAGMGDQQQATSRLASAREALVQAKRDLIDARVRYLRLVDEEPDALTRPDVPVGELPADRELAVRHALMNNPTINASAAELDAAHANHRSAAANYYPRVTFDVSGAANRNLDGVRGLNNEGMALMKMSYNLFRGGIDANRRMEAVERISENRASVMKFERAVAEEVRLSWSAWQSAGERAKVLAEEAMANSQVVAAYRQEFDIGQRDLLDLLDAENELFLSRNRTVSAEYAESFAVFRILAGMGRLTEVMGVAVPGESDAAARKGAGVETERTAPFIERNAGTEETAPAAPVPAAPVEQRSDLLPQAAEPVPVAGVQPPAVAEPTELRPTPDTIASVEGAWDQWLRTPAATAR